MSKTAASPATRRLARQNDIDIDALGAELDTDMVTRRDVERRIAGETPTSGGEAYWQVDHSNWGPVTAEPTTSLDRVAAANLAAAHMLIPAVTHHDRADTSALEAARARFRSEAEPIGIRLTALAFHIKILARALAEFPRFNASLSADGKTLWMKHYTHIGIAIDTPKGLVVPVIRDVDKKGLLQIAEEVSDLAGRSRERRIRPNEMGGASMSISSLGSIGGMAFTPMINPPEVAILGITRTEIAPVWDGEAFQPKPMLPLDLTYDHRVINGADAARFLSCYCGLVAAPESLLL